MSEKSIGHIRLPRERTPEEDCVIASAYRYRKELIEAIHKALPDPFVVELPDGKKLTVQAFRPTAKERMRISRERKFRTIVNFECAPFVEKSDD